MTLNLDAKTNEERKVKAYLEANASDILAEKINNGVHVQKDGKTLLNKKTLAGFMKFACDEAKKQAEKGAQSACIDDDVVYGWAVHYFEEDSIEGTLYNEDGTEYKPPKPVTPSNPVTIYTTPKPQPKPQMSLFELMENNANEEKPSENAQDVSQKSVQPDNPDRDDEEPCDDADTDEESTEEELREAAETEEGLPLPAIPEKAKAVQMQGSPFYQRYMQVQDKYPDHIVLFSRGDFYEALGKGAQILSENLALTLTGRDCGLLERVPMVGVPHHAVDNYIVKALECGLKIVLPIRPITSKYIRNALPLPSLQRQKRHLFGTIPLPRTESTGSTKKLMSTMTALCITPKKKQTVKMTNPCSICPPMTPKRSLYSTNCLEMKSY